MIGIALSILLLATTTNSATAQNLTTNASNAAGNASASVNQTASEVGQNMSNAVGNASSSANQTMSELGQNASTTLNRTGESANATLSEFGKNVSDAGKTVLNKTVEVAKDIGSGAPDVLRSASLYNWSIRFASFLY